MLKHYSYVRVRYADTDQMKYAYNGKYFEYFEVGRTEMMREVGLPYKVIEENGYFMPVPCRTAPRTARPNPPWPGSSGDRPAHPLPARRPNPSPCNG